MNLSQQEAQIRAENLGTTPYDAMLSLYEPGTTSTSLDSVFNDVKTWLPNLVDQVIENKVKSPLFNHKDHFQLPSKALGLKIMQFYNLILTMAA